MNLDLKLTQIALKMKNLVILDLSFSGVMFPEFKSAYEFRYVHIPCRQEMALDMAGGMASQGKVVVLYGSNCEDCDLLDSSLNVKMIKHSENAVWNYFEEGLMEFGSSVLLVPAE